MPACYKANPFPKAGLYTFLPDLADPKKVSLIEGGFSGFVSVENLDGPIELLISEHLKTQENIFLMEVDSTTREAASRLYFDKPFSFFVSAPSTHTFYDAARRPTEERGVGVYGYVREVDEEMGNVKKLILDCRPFGAIGVLSSVPTTGLPPDGEDCDPRVFKELAASTQYILGTAYDDEGWIIWAREHLPENFKVEGKIF